MLGIPLGFLTVNIVEWIFHKYVLHGLGKNKNSMWSPHWHIHHKSSRKNNMVDTDYLEPLPVLLETYELKSILIGATAIIPFIKKFPFFVTTVWICGMAYYLIHRRSHIDEQWAKKWVPHHYDHHFIDQNNNWNVTIPLMDYIMGTRVKERK